MPMVWPSCSIRKCDSPSSALMVSTTALFGSPHHFATVGSLKISRSSASSPARTERRTTFLPRSSGGEVDPNRAQTLVQGFEGKGQDLALRMTKLRDVARVGRVKGA